jgi:transcriptional regulator with XRE-family HTH domain
MDESDVGRRVAYWRRRRRMSQQVFADRLGKSKSWVDKVERGARRLDKCSVVREIAEVLQVEVRLLLDREPQRRADSAAGAARVDVEAIRNSLERYVDTAALFHRSPVHDSPFRSASPQDCLPEVDKAVAHAWLTLQRADYVALSQVLPRLLHAAQVGGSMHAGTQQQDAAADLLGQVYQIASSALWKLGEAALAWVAADRAVAHAVRGTDELLVGPAKARVGRSLLALGRPRPALEVGLHTAGQFAPDGNGSTTPQRLSVYGTLLLDAAMAAAQLGDRATVRDLVHGAEHVAAELGGDFNHYWTCFGPTNVQLYKAAAAVHLGDGRAAIDTHESLDGARFSALPAERRANHYLDIARAYTQIGQPHAAARLLLAADQTAAPEVRYRPAGQEVLTEVIRRTRTDPPAQIRSLAEQLRVAV